MKLYGLKLKVSNYFRINIYKMEASTNLTNEIESLKTKLTGNMMKDMEIRDQIHNLEMKLKGVKPEDSHFDCIGCGS